MKRSEGIAISGSLILGKAKYFKEKVDLETLIAFSDGWLNRFKIHHGIRKLDITDETEL